MASLAEAALSNREMTAEIAPEESAAPAAHERDWLVGVPLGLLCLIAVVAAMYLARAFFVPLLLGILASYALRPIVEWLGARYVPRAVGAALVLLLLSGSLGWVGYAFSGDAAAMSEKLPEAARKLRESLSGSRQSGNTPLQNIQRAAKEIQGAAADATQILGTKAAPAKAAADSSPSQSAWLRDYVLGQSGQLLSVASQAPMVLLLAYFLLASGVHFRRKLVQFVGPSLSRKKDAVRILEEIEVQVQRYLLVTLVSNALVGVGTGVAFAALGVEHAGAWAVVAGVSHFVPYIGPALVVLGAGIAAFVQFQSLLPALAAAGAALLVAALIGLVLTTWLQSRGARVNAAVLFIALLFFGWLWGVWGLLLGAPLVAIVKVVCDRLESLKPVGELLGR